MLQILILIGALIALKLLGPVLRVLIAAIAGKAVGQAVIAQLPDQIRLEPSDANVWKNRAAVGAIAGGLRPLGFADAGTYTIVEMPGTAVRLLVDTSGGFYAAIYEHPQAGVWYDLVTRYADGSSITFTSAKPTGLASRPDHPTVHLKQMSVADACTHARAERPKVAYANHAIDCVVRDFEAGYADSMAWRKNSGVSTQEAVSVAMKKAA